MIYRLLDLLQKRARGEEMSIGSQVAKQFQDEGHAYYDELVEMVDTRAAALESELATERARADTLAAVFKYLLKAQEKHITRREYDDAYAALALHQQTREGERDG